MPMPTSSSPMFSMLENAIRRLRFRFVSIVRAAKPMLSRPNVMKSFETMGCAAVGRIIA